MNQIETSTDDRGEFIQPTLEGGYIITGKTSPGGEEPSDVLLVKIDADGKHQWTKTYGGSGWDTGRAVFQTDDGYMILAQTGSFGPGREAFYAIKTDLDGNEVWWRTYGEMGNYAPMSGAETSDGGFVMVGISVFSSSDIDIHVIKIDWNGTQEWSRKYGGDGDEWGLSIQQTEDGGYVLCGFTRSYGLTTDKGIVIKLSPEGDEEWHTLVGSEWSKARSVIQTSDRGYVITGWDQTLGNSKYEVLLVKLGPHGDTRWTKRFSVKNDDNMGLDIKQLEDGGFLVVGDAHDDGEESDILVLRVDQNGRNVRTKMIGGASSERGYDSVVQGEDVVVLGRKRNYHSNIYLVKIGLPTEANYRSYDPFTVLVASISAVVILFIIKQTIPKDKQI